MGFTTLVGVRSQVKSAIKTSTTIVIVGCQTKQRKNIENTFIEKHASQRLFNKHPAYNFKARTIIISLSYNFILSDDYTCVISDTPFSQT